MLVLEFEGGHSLIIHLMMVGQLLLSPPFTGQPRDVCLELRFADDALRLPGSESRDEHATGYAEGARPGARLTLGQVRLKYIHLLPTAKVDAWPSIAKLGVDPLDESFTIDLLQKLLARRRGAVKSALMDQSLVAGLGNVYTDEILFRAKLHPQRRASDLSDQEVRQLHASIVAELRRGLELGGSSEMAFVHLDGSEGSYQESFRVKRRQGRSCLVCTTPIERVKVGGRGSYLCPCCQPSHPSSSSSSSDSSQSSSS
jgi:formamidopyrimidine-DNA glycosylase